MKLFDKKFDYLKKDEELVMCAEADYFARVLLVPEWKLRKIIKELGQSYLYHLEAIADYFAVDQYVIVQRIKDLNL